MDDAKAVEQALIDDESVSNTKKMKAKIKLAGLEAKGKKLKNMFFSKIQMSHYVSLCVTMCHYIGCNLLLYKVNVSFLLQVDITFSQQISKQ